jgi:hypothetical protein
VLTTVSFLMPATAAAARPTSCPTYEKTALAVGWPRKEMKRLTYVMARESSCAPTAHNKSDPFGGSYGLTQINGSNKTFLIKNKKVTKFMTELFNPKKNLKAALALWKECGWACWGFNKKGTNEYPRRKTVAHFGTVS